MHDTKWLVMASAAQALIYELKRPDYRLRDTLLHTASHEKTAELVADKPGSHHTAQTTQGEFIAASDAHQKEQSLFAKDLADALEQGRNNHAYSTLIICAEPHFYGLLLQELPDTTHALIEQSIKKNYIPLPEKERDELINKIMWGELN